MLKFKTEIDNFIADISLFFFFFATHKLIIFATLKK